MWAKLSKTKQFTVLAINAVIIAGVVVVAQQMRFQNLAPTNSVAETLSSSTAYSASASISVTESTASTRTDTSAQDQSPELSTSELRDTFNNLDLNVKIAIGAMAILAVLMLLVILRPQPKTT